MDWWSSTQWIVLQNPMSSATLPPALLLSLSLGLTAFSKGCSTIENLRLKCAFACLDELLVNECIVCFEDFHVLNAENCNSYTDAFCADSWEAGQRAAVS